MSVTILPPSPEYITGFNKAKGVYREVVRDPNFHPLEVYIENSDQTAWVDGRRKQNKDGSMSHLAVGVMVDVTALSVVEEKDENGVVTLRRASALDIRVGNDIRFDPKLLQVEFGKFQFVVGGTPMAIHHIQCATILAKEALDAFFKVSGRALFADKVATELRKHLKDDRCFDPDDTENIKAVEWHVYHYYLDKTARNYQQQLKALVDNKTLVPSYLRLHAQLQDGQSISRTTNYLNGRRLIVATVAGNTSCAAVGGEGMMGVYQDEPAVLSEGKAWLKPYELTDKYTAATKLTETDTEYSRHGLVEAMTEKAKLSNKRKSPEPQKKDEEPDSKEEEPEKNDEKVCAEIHPMGVAGVNFFGAQCFLTLQCRGAPAEYPKAKSMSGGATRSAGSGPRAAVPVDTAVCQAREVRVMAMNLSAGTKVEKTPLPLETTPPWEDQIQGATCFFITNAKLSAVADDGKATSVLQTSFTADAVRPSLKKAVDVFEGLAHAVSTGAGFQNLSDSKCIVKEEDMTTEQKAIEQQAQMKIHELSVSQLLMCSNNEIDEMASTPAEVEVKPLEMDYEALEAQGLKVGTTGAFQKLILPLPEGYDACGAGMLGVIVKKHDGKDDDQGSKLEAVVVNEGDSKGEGAQLLFNAPESWLVRTTVKNLGSEPCSFFPVYVGEDGSEEPEDQMDLAYGEEVEIPYPIDVDDKGQCHWVLRHPTTGKARATFSFCKQ